MELVSPGYEGVCEPAVSRVEVGRGGEGVGEATVLPVLPFVDALLALVP